MEELVMLSAVLASFWLFLFDDNDAGCFDITTVISSPGVCTIHVDPDLSIRASVLQLAVHPPVAVPSIVPCALRVHAFGGILPVPQRKQTPILSPEASGEPFWPDKTTRRCFWGRLLHGRRKLEPMVLPELHPSAVHHHVRRHFHRPCCIQRPEGSPHLGRRHIHALGRHGPRGGHEKVL